MVDEERSDPATIEKAENGQLPPGTELYYDRSENPILVKKEVMLRIDCPQLKYYQGRDHQ